MRNFVTDMLRFWNYASSNGLTANEVILFQGLFQVFNERHWPDGPQAISTNHLLDKTTFHSTKRDDTLRDARQKLADRGLISYEKGVAYRSFPTYTIHWEVFAPEDTPDDAPEHAPEDTPKNRGMLGGINKTINEKGNGVSPSPVSDTHTQSGVVGNARAREADTTGCGKPCGQPDDLSEYRDEAWRYSDRVRASVAGRIIRAHDHHLQHRYTVSPSEEILDACHLHSVLMTAMANGHSPEHLSRMAERCTEDWELQARVQKLVMDKGGIMPDKWRHIRQDIEECLDDLEIDRHIMSARGDPR